MTKSISRDDLALYVMGAYDGDVDALEARIAEAAAARAMLAEEAELELALRAAGATGAFCPNCDDLVAETTEPVRCVSCGAAVAPGGYRIERVLVANAHGRMYIARDADGTRVALKELAFVQSPSSETVAAFEREAKFLRALEHPAIPRFRAAFEEGTGVHTRYYLAQDLVDGTALDAHLADHFYTEAEIVDIARQVLGVLVYLQGLSPMVIHRDIKPANLIQRADGTIAVVDFGAAHVQGTTAGSTSIGTFGYMPLEQLAGQVDATTDTFALGTSLLHLLTRREPWRVFGPAMFDSLNVSLELRRFLATCVAPEPKDRFASAALALAALYTPSPRTARISRRAWKIGAGVLAATLALGGAGVAAYELRGDEPAKATKVKRTSDDPILDRLNAEHDKATVERAKVTYAALREYITRAQPNTPRFESVAPIDLDFTAAPPPVVLRAFATGCGVNIVAPSQLRAPITLHATKAPCGQIFEAMIEAHGYEYVYRDKANALVIVAREELERERVDAVNRAIYWAPADPLPAGNAVNFDYTDTEVREVLEAIARANQVNLVMPDDVRGQVTILAKNMPWTVALRGVLSTQGLDFRYRADGRILTVAPPKQLEREDLRR